VDGTHALAVLQGQPMDVVEAAQSSLQPIACPHQLALLRIHCTHILGSKLHPMVVHEVLI
jgi:hypothetical protein